MVAIRNRNVNIPHVFRYPQWEQSVYYPEGSLTAYKVAGDPDSDTKYWNFYGAIRHVNAGGLPPPSNLDWRLVFDGAAEGRDSEILDRLQNLDEGLDSEIRARIEADSDFNIQIRLAVHNYLANDSEHDSDIRKSRHDDIALDSDLRQVDSEIRHDFRAADSDIYKYISTFYRDSDIHVHSVHFGENDSEAVLTWNPQQGSLDLTKVNGVTVHLGQEIMFYGKATNDGPITKGQVVMFGGAQGDHLLFKVADTSSVGYRNEFIIGVAAQDFAKNQYGYVTSQGVVRGLNTSKFADGALLHLSNIDPGTLIDSEPPSPQYDNLIAVVTRSHNNQGSIYVRPTLGTKIVQHEDVRVNTTTLDYNDMLVWNDSENVFVNKDLNELMGPHLDYGSF